MSAAGRRLSLGRLLAWAALLGMLLVTLLPLWFALKTALVPSQQLYEQSATLVPHDPTLLNFRRVLGLLSPEQSLAVGGSGAEINFLRALGNSVLFTVVIVTLQVGCAAMAAYAFARLCFPGRDLLFALFVGTMMVPGVVTFIPNFILIKELGWLDTYAGMVAPFCLMQGFSVFFLRQFFLAIPRDIEEAALLEGASQAYIFARVALPLSSSALATIAMLTGINIWNEFFWPYLVAKDEAHQVLTVALQTFKSQTPQGQPDWTGLMAATAVAVLPVLVLLLAFGRRIIESVQHSGGK
ncbi:carbohydrate ABC transporter permease [Roseateles saccharophilus]|uniref:Carbohydrate ABC transporter membrane protein 2 (CUT1 family) n=1 Tax=Roseateles saccharophilus TaxID=304 RepID=A0A4R3VET5_ROSSA|nr:carbohydrate ABC transporter permease [Roseateles saccharophilus]MDG0835380.1 carbohydrate ABC transporter permease [Roseateles saccharophilus]TCV02242.1 carbohydrate ABC transporter membrane protein 2 (CUT1 family) [Roseateles saccharophilus]